MSLIKKHNISPKQRAANRLNGRRSRGALTPKGRSRAAASNLRHGYYSQSAEVVLTALGEDPAKFKRRLDSLIDTYAPADALEMSLVMQLARALWQMERFHRLAESLVVKHLEHLRKGNEIKEAILCMPLMEKLERLKKLYAATCLDLDISVGSEEMQVFENCRGDLAAEKALAILQLLLRRREPGTTEDLGPAAKMLLERGEIPAAEGEERKAVWRELSRTLALEIQPLEKRIFGDVMDGDTTQAQIDRDKLLADAQPKAVLMNRGEESSLRQVVRITHLLMEIKKAARAQENVENEGRSHYVDENKGA